MKGRTRVALTIALAGVVSSVGVLVAQTNLADEAPDAGPPQRSHTATLGFVGDVLPHKLIHATADRFSNDPNHGFDHVVAELQGLASSVDLAAFNMESPVVATPRRPLARMRFWSPPDLPRALYDIGFDVASCANNHSFDQARSGITETRAHLAQIGLHALGCGSREESDRPTVITVHGIRVALVAFTSVLNHDLEGVARGQGPTALLWVGDGVRVRNAVADARRQADYVVVIAHWDREYHTTPRHETRNIARAVVDAGADLIVGQHPHVLQPAETWHVGTRTAHVIFSLGNAISEMGFGERPDSMRDTRLSVFARVRLLRHATRVVAELSFIPLWIRHAQHCVGENNSSAPGICVQPVVAEDGSAIGARRALLIRAFMGPHLENNAPVELFPSRRERSTNTTQR